jgi:hypothetical protein
MNVNQSEFHLSDNEQIVRNYECTKRSRLLGPAVIGYLTITNKRIVYHCQAKSMLGSSAVLSEVALDDFSGLRTSISSSFNWIFFLLFCLIMYWATFFFMSILPQFVTGWFVAIFLTLPYLFTLLFDKNILSQEFQQQFFQSINQIPGSTLLRRKDRLYYTGLFRLLFWIGVALMSWNLLRNSELSQFSVFTFLLFGVVYYFLYRAIFGRVRIFNLTISSRSPKHAGISIPGNAISFLLGGDAVVQSIYAGPGQDADRIVSELGAILTDIRQLGDFGIQKWTRMGIPSK